MPWHRVILKHREDAHLLAQGLMIPFMKQYKGTIRPKARIVFSLHVVIMLWWALGVQH
jgi:hypothetical protein